MLKTPKGEIWRIEISEEVTIYFAIGFLVKFCGTRLLNWFEKLKVIVDF